MAFVDGPIDGLIDFGGGPVIDRDEEAFLDDVKGEVLGMKLRAFLVKWVLEVTWVLIMKV